MATGDVAYGGQELLTKPPEADDLGWKETIRVSPLEDTYVAMRPIIPVLPFDCPNSVRLISPMMPEGAWIANTTFADLNGLPLLGFAPNGEPIDIVNHYVNFGAEYVYHCHILSHEEMDMMHGVMYAYPPVAPSGLAFDPLTGALTWTDNSLSETAFVVERSSDGGGTWTVVGRVDRDLLAPATKGDVLSFGDLEWADGDLFRVVAQNIVGDTWDYADPNLNELLPGTYAFPVATLEVTSAAVGTTPPPASPAAPSDLAATLEAGPQVSLAWTDNSLDETGFAIERSTDGTNFSPVATVAADTTGYVDTAVLAGATYTYRVAAFNLGGTSAFAVSNAVAIPGPQVPAAPEGLEATFEDVPLIHLQWTDNASDETGFAIERSTDGTTFSALATVGADVTAYDDLAVFGGYTYTYRVAAFNANGTSAYAVSNSVLVPADATPPAAPSNLSASSVTQTSLTLNWVDNANNEAGFTIQRAENASFSKNLVTASVGPDVTSYADSGLKKNTKYYYRVQSLNGFNDGAGPFPWSPTLNVTTANK